MRGQDYGEIIVFATFGLFFLIVVGWNYYWGDYEERAVSKYLVMLMLIGIFFGVVVYLIHVRFLNHPILDVVFATLENGGKHLIMSFILCFVFSITSLTKEESRLKFKALRHANIF